MNKQSGFTLIELAIVLVIIGLLLGGVLKGQELINSAKVKSLVSDFKNVPVYIYGYQDKFKALPGDDKIAQTHLGTSATNSTSATLGFIDGAWDSNAGTDDSILFWQHVRLAGLAPGPTLIGDVASFVPKNSNGGRVGVTSIAPITGMTGSYFVCSSGIDAKFALQMDITMDNGDTTTGTVQTIQTVTPSTVTTPIAINATTTGIYTVCQSF
jgi:prepilin-type N-terminal cleavage/methylation domain-containing protein